MCVSVTTEGRNGEGTKMGEVHRRNIKDMQRKKEGGRYGRISKERDIPYDSMHRKQVDPRFWLGPRLKRESRESRQSGISMLYLVHTYGALCVCQCD